MLTLENPTKEKETCLELSKKMLQAINEKSVLQFDDSQNNDEFGKHTMLYFGYAPVASHKEYRDGSHNLVRSSYFFLALDCGINPHGVGDGKEPEIARTFSAHFYIPSTVRMYRHKHFHEHHFCNFYAYDREMMPVVERLAYHIQRISVNYPHLFTKENTSR